MNHPCPDALELMAIIERIDWSIKLPILHWYDQLYAHKLRAKTLQEFEDHKRTCEVCDDS